MLMEEKRLQNGTHFPARRRQYDCNRDAFSVTFLVILVDHNVIRPQPRQSNINFAPIAIVLAPARQKCVPFWRRFSPSSRPEIVRRFLSVMNEAIHVTSLSRGRQAPPLCFEGVKKNNGFLEKSAGRRSQHSPFFSWGSPPNPPWSCRRHKLRSGW